MKLTINVQDDILDKAERLARSKSMSVEAAILDYLTRFTRDIAAIDLPTEATTQSLLMHRHDGRDQVVNAAMIHWSEFERPMPQYLYSCARRWPGLMIDVGANSGFYGLLAAVADPGNRVLAFEPDPPVHEALRQNIVANNLQNRITALAMALSSKVGMAALFVPSQEHGLVETSSSLEASFKDSHSEVRQVMVSTLDHFLSASAHGPSPVSLIKMDVEGHEASVLDGSHETVARWKPILFVEVLPRADLAMLSSFIARHGYVDVPLHPSGMPTAHGAVSYDQAAWNHAFVPPERLMEFLQFSRIV